MKKQTVMWTALPNGIVGIPGEAEARVRLSVSVSPRLQTNEGGDRPTLSQFPDFLDWPARAQEVQFSVQFGDREPLAAATVPAPSDPPPSELWGSILDSSTYVKPYEFPDLATRPILSFPVRNVLSRLKEAYTNVAIDSPVELPRLTPEDQKLQGVRGLFQEISLTPQRNLQIAAQVTGRINTSELKVFQPPSYEAATSRRVVLGKAAAAQPSPVLANVSPAALEFHQLQTFHQPLTATRVAMPRVQELVAAIDFHQIIATLGQYPQLLRRLGLVIDLEVPFDASLVGSATVRVLPQWAPQLGGASSDVTPTTHCTLSSQVFRAKTRSADSDLREGMLRLDDDERFEVGQVDVDGAAIKTMDLARKVMLQPALTIAPRTLSRTGRLIGRRGAAITEAGPTPEPEPEAEEAALPSLRSSGLWVARVNRATTVATALQRAATFNLALTQQREEDVGLYAEDLVRGYRTDVWDEASGQWHSLCSRVGTYQFTKSEAEVTVEDEGWVSTAATESPDGSSDLRVHEVMFRWEGWSLSAPRPGKAVESDDTPTLAQPDMGLDASFVAAADSLPRLRFGNEYRLRARAVDLAGNSLSPDEADDSAATDPLTYFRHEPLVTPVLVPRTDLTGSPGESLERPVIRSFNNAPPKDNLATTEQSQRHAAPPKTSQLMAETHGMFDEPDGMKGDAATYNLITSRDESLAGSYNVPQLVIPYLPDPLAEGALIRFKPLFAGDDAPEQVLRIPFDGTWPDLRPFRLMLYEHLAGRTEVVFDEDRRVLRVPLPKAEQAEILISSYTKTQQLPHLGMWRWIVEGVAAPALRTANLPQAETKQVFRQLHDVRQMPRWMNRVNLSRDQIQQVTTLKQEAEGGKHWMLTPSRRIILVHAVQQPLIIPDLRDLAALKSIGDTYATLSDRMPISGKSTAKLDILSQWEEPIDPLGEPRPRRLAGKADIGELPLEPEDTEANVRMRQEFGDTKYRRVTYTAVATSRFREYFDPDRVAAGDIDLTRTSPEVTVDVLSSARPSAPTILYVIPTFGWQRTKSGNRVTSTRAGGGLRVYLERPWYSSGDGELLGAVLPQQQRLVLTTAATIGAGDRLKRYVTQWGQDPLWRSAPVKSAAPPPEAFTAAQATESNLTLDELPGVRVAVAGHEVGYDEERQLWYCDIEIDPGEAYFPFVRLALARYQPMSVKTASTDVKLSRVVLADFAQLAPDRTATVVPDARDQTKLQVTVTGTSYLGSEVQRRGSHIEVSVEKRMANAEGVAGWIPAGTEVFPLAHQVGRRQSAWTGAVTLPTERGSQPFRLVIREYEVFRSDKPATGTMAIALIMGTERRLIYADALEI